MSDVSQGPGWWLASDGKWYPPHTAPQAPPVVDTGGSTAAPSQPESGQWSVNPASFSTAAPGPASAPSPVGSASGGPAGGAAATESTPTWGAVGFQPHFPAPTPSSYGYPPSVGAPNPDVAVGPTAGPAGSPAPVAAPAHAERRPAAAAPVRRHWQPALALVGIGLVLWGAGQGLLTWAQWKVVRVELSPVGTVTQGHIGMALTAAGIVVAGVAAIVAALVLDRR
jgi:hypothetical protein